MEKYNYVILGAGITGLSAAYHLKNLDYAIFESENRIGGMCKTESINGFLFDYAEHFIRVDDLYVKKIIKKLLKSNVQSQNLNSAIYISGNYTGYPFQTNLFGLPPEIIKECLVGYIKAVYETDKKEIPKNFEEWIYKNFGDGIAKHFMLPYNEKIWNVHPREMNINWFFSDKVVPKGSIEQLIEGAIKKTEEDKQIRWYTVKGGIESLAKSFIPHIKNLYLNEKVVKIIPSKKRVIFGDGKSVEYNYLISTIPLKEFIKIIGDSAPNSVKKASEKLKYNSLLCVNFGVNRDKISDKHWIYFPDKDIVFSRVYFPMNFSSSMVPKGKSSVGAIITYSDKKPINKKNIVKIVQKDLIKTSILKEDDEILIENIVNIKYGFSIPDLNLPKNIDVIQKYLLKNDVHSIGRYGNWEYAGIEHSILDGKNIAEKLK
ncbi:MAG: hypothetical protein CVT89_00400 [Candidatus Altiarchaeales archaeon HGW-Altiarchaeales-2]|nr:MAG: hypothetical protein CVT89_00400 [Candidatus Altiarchaeales archaeon HGW-Altiarchaeales-2]